MRITNAAAEVDFSLPRQFGNLKTFWFLVITCEVYETTTQKSVGKPDIREQIVSQEEICTHLCRKGADEQFPNVCWFAHISQLLNLSCQLCSSSETTRSNDMFRQSEVRFI